MLQCICPYFNGFTFPKYHFLSLSDLLYFSWWFSENILPQIGNVDIHYIYFTDEVVYAGDEPFDYFGFEVVEDDSGAVQPAVMDELPDEIRNADQPNLC